MQPSNGTSHRIIFLMACSLAAAAVAVEAGSLTGIGELWPLVPSCAVLLLCAATALWYVNRELTERIRSAEDTTARSHSELQAAMDNMSQGLVLCDRAANVVAVNNRFLQLFGVLSHQVRRGMTVAELIRLQAAAGNMTAAHAEVLVDERLNRPPGASGRLEMPFRSGLLEVAYQPRPEGGWACTFEDVTAQKKAEQRIAFLAKHDSLTSLPDRTVLLERIEAAIASGAAFAVMFLDLDGFKSVNDTFGHSAGDALLCAVAERLRRWARENDTVARLGGDEFAAVLAAPCTREEVDWHVIALTRALAEPLLIEGHRLQIRGSIGISLALDAIAASIGVDPTMLLRQADLAVYRAKQQGRGTHRFFDATMVQKCELPDRMLAAG